MPENGRLAELGHEERGQSTVEYALALFAFVATIVALGTVWHAAREGVLLRLCMGALSHGLTAAGGIGFTQDVFLY